MSDGCQEKIVPRSETHPQKGQAHPAATGCADAAAVPKPLATLTQRRMGQLCRPAQSPADRKNVRGPLGVSGTLYAAYTPLAPDREAMEKLLAMAIAAWNVALFPGGERAQRLRELSTTLPAEARTDFLALIREMIA